MSANGQPAHGTTEGQVQLSFEEARQIFLAANPDLREAQARADADRYDAQIPALWPNPTLSVQRNQTDVPGDGFGSENNVAITQPLRYPSEYMARRAAASSAATASQAEYDERASSLYKTLQIRYTAAMAARARLTVLESTTEAVRRAVEIADIRFQEGDISPFERSRIRVALATYEDEIAAARLEDRDTRIELAHFLRPSEHSGHHDMADRRIVLTDSLTYEELSLDYGRLVEMAIQRRGQTNAAVARIREKEETVRAERYARLPDLAVTIGYRAETRPGLVEPGFTVGLQIGLPVFHQRQPQVREARASARAARYEADIARREVELSVHEAYEDLMSYQQRLERIAGEVLEGSGALLSDALYVYEEGELDLVGLLDAVEAAKTSRLLRINLIEQHRRARHALEQAIGMGPTDPSPLDGPSSLD
jgi:cobalt-zinc-cadmium efflux system outer membrane protein